jgi:MFS family permease
MRHGDYPGVQKALGSFGAEVSVQDVEYTARQLEEADRRAQRRNKWTPGVRRALIVVCVFFIFQQITGINVPLYYGPHLLGPLFQGSSSMVDKTISGVEVTLMLTAVNVAATYFAFRWIDRKGRRKLAIGGYIGMALAALLAAAGLTFFTGTTRIVVVMIGLAAFIASFAIGVGGTGWLLQGEVFPTDVRGRAASTGATVDWLANFALVEVFPIWQSGIGLGWVLACFAALCVLAIGFVYRFVPETKGHSVEEITEIFDREASGATAVQAAA